MTGPIPSELGNLANLEKLYLWKNQLYGPIPPELGNLANLESLDLGYNNLTGPIPSELGNLANLEKLYLWKNQLYGPIPPELGNLANLESLDLGYNNLTGPIPTALGNPDKLERLYLSSNYLTGPIPPELGNFHLKSLFLGGNRLIGSIPPELGNLANLELLVLAGNQLTGSIPPELGDLINCWYLGLQDNALSGFIPPELGNLINLRIMDLRDNRLLGPIPSELGNLATSLKSVDVTDNSGMSGTLPGSLTDLGQLEEFRAGGTELCAPRNADFQRWLSRILEQRVATCTESRVSTAYITQAVQSFHFPVTLVAGEDALLRVFVVDDDAGSEYIPQVRATFYRDGVEAGLFNIPQGSDTIPAEVIEGDLSASANANIPGELIQPGLEMVIEIDPEGTLDPALNVTTRIPETGRAEINVRVLPELRFVVIPFLWVEAPDSAILDQTNEMAVDPERHDLLWGTRTLLPVSDVFVDRHEPVLTSSNSGPTLAGEALAIQAMEGTSDFHLGMMSGPVEGGVLGSAAFRGGGFSVPRSSSIAHTIGHFVGLRHAPCGVAYSDPDYPSANGVIAAWGYDFPRWWRPHPSHPARLDVWVS